MSKDAVDSSWFSNMWWNSRRVTTALPVSDKAVIGVLTLEVANLMTKVVNLWYLLGEKEISKLREEIVDSDGVQRLVSCDGVYLMDLALNEIVENFGAVSMSVARFGRKCEDPHFRRFELFVNDPIQYSYEWLGWDYRLKKMEKNVKKMERFIAFTLQLSQEIEVLAELEQTLRRMKANPDLERGKLVEFQHKVAWQRQEVKYLREMSPWFRTYDYIVRLLARSLLTILERTRHVFQSHQQHADTNHDHFVKQPDCLPRSRSFSVLLQSPVYPSDNILCGLPSGPVAKAGSKPLPSFEKCKSNKKAPTLYRKNSRFNTRRLSQAASFGGCMTSGIDSPVLQKNMTLIGGSMRLGKDISKMEELNSGSLSCSDKIYIKLALFSKKGRLLIPPTSTLGDAGLAVRYANVILMIEKLASSPQMINSKTRAELYEMLPSTIRDALRSRLMAVTKSRTPSLSDVILADNCNLAVTNILEWLSPLAHNMTQWHSARNIEREHTGSATNLLLVQTLHFANQAKTEAAIIELLVGLSYICKINRQNFRQAQSFGISGCRTNDVNMPKMNVQRFNLV